MVNHLLCVHKSFKTVFTQMKKMKDKWCNLQCQNFVKFVNCGLKYESGNNIRFREKRDIEGFAGYANLAYF
jgi:hypothetical protein